MPARRTCLAARQWGADKWDVGYFIDDLRDALPADWRDFLVALLAAINDPARASDLDRFPLWRDTPAVPLATPWPEPEGASQTAPSPAA